MVDDISTEACATPKDWKFYANSPNPTIILIHLVSSLLSFSHSFIPITAHAYPYFLGYNPEERYTNYLATYFHPARQCLPLSSLIGSQWSMDNYPRLSTHF